MKPVKTILIVDDEVNLRRSLSLILQRAGYQTATAESAQEALRTLESGPFNLVILDLKMPGTSGLDLLPQLVRAYPEMPIAMLTAHATLESAIEAIQKGACDYILKPINPMQMIARLETILASSDQAKRRREILGEMQNLLNELGQQLDDVSAELNND
jgi:DNA-binding NtrC family response regulator